MLINNIITLYMYVYRKQINKNVCVTKIVFYRTLLSKVVLSTIEVPFLC